MKKSNELILLVALLAASFVVPTLRAQDNPDRPAGDRPPRREQMGERMKMMAEELGLTDDQKAQVKEIMKESMEAGKAIRDDQSLTPEQRREKMQANRKSTEEKINALLTPEQKAKQKEIRASRGPGGPGGPEGDRPAKKHKKAEKAE